MGGKTVVQEAPKVTASESAKDVLEAQLATNPRAAQQSFQIATSPEYGLEPFTKAIEQARANVLPQESAVRNQLLQNILSNLVSPTGISTEQQAGIAERRGQAQNELQRAMRERANLGGGLYGGRAAAAEARSVGELQNLFAEEDIAREERARLNAIQSALPALQVLFPEIGISAPQFVSPAPSGSAALQAGVSQRGQDIQQALAQQQQRSALQSALFSGLGSAAGGFSQNPNVFK